MGYVVTIYFYHNICVVSFELWNVLKYVMTAYKDSVS